MNASIAEALDTGEETQTENGVVAELMPHVSEIENLDKDQAFSLIAELSENVDYNYFRLGGVLSVVQSNGFWKDEGAETFRAFIEMKFGMNYRKAMYLISIYNGLVDSKVPYSKVKHLGWSKLKELADILTPDNVDEWVAKAEAMTVLQLQEAVKNAKKGTLQAGSEDTAADKPTGTTTLTFKVHPDQKETILAAIEKAKVEAGTEFNTVALEAICLNYATGAKVAAPKGEAPSLLSIVKEMDPHEVLETVAAAFPEWDIKATEPA